MADRRGMPAAARPVLFVVLALLASVEARAQQCLGRALEPGSNALVAELGRPWYELQDELAGFDQGIAFWADPPGWPAFSVRYLRRELDGVRYDVHVFSGDFVLQFPEPIPVPLAPEGCAFVGLAAAFPSGSRAQADYFNVAVPVGFGVGFPIPVGRGSQLTPFLAPQLILSLTEGSVLGDDVQDRFAGVGIEAGVGLAWGQAVVRGILFASDPLDEFRGRLGTPAHPTVRMAIEVGVSF